MSERIDDVVDQAWQMFRYYVRFWVTGSRRLAIERVATYAYREGLKDQGARSMPLTEVPQKPVRVVLEQHKSLLMSVVAAALGATGSAAITSQVNGWWATGAAWGTAVLGIVVAGVRTWVRG